MIAKLLAHADTGATERDTHVQVEQTKPLVEARWGRLLGRCKRGRVESLRLRD